MPRRPANRNRPTATDSDNPAWGGKEFERARPAYEVLPPAAVKALASRATDEAGQTGVSESSHDDEEL